MDMFAGSIDSYFAHARRDIEALLPDRAQRILEIGCSSGATLAWLKERWPDAETFGVDGYAPLEPFIRKRADHALIHDLESPLPELGTFDLILALDVLEHLRTPEPVLADLVRRLTPDGVCIVSVPNVATYQVAVPLLFRRQFRYTDAGTLDRTHLRWFTEESALGLMRDAGLRVTEGLMAGFDGRRRRLFNLMTFGLFRHHLATQYMMRGTRTGPDGPVRWRQSCALPPWTSPRPS